MMMSRHGKALCIIVQFLLFVRGIPGHPWIHLTDNQKFWALMLSLFWAWASCCEAAEFPIIWGALVMWLQWHPTILWNVREVNHILFCWYAILYKPWVKRCIYLWKQYVQDKVTTMYWISDWHLIDSMPWHEIQRFTSDIWNKWHVWFESMENLICRCHVMWKYYLRLHKKFAHHLELFWNIYKYFYQLLE